MTYLEELWRTPERVAQALEEPPEPMLADAGMLVFCGCGTSYYLCAQLANIARAYGRRACALEAVQVLEDGVSQLPEDAVFVFLSRSGASRETVLAQERIAGAGGRCFYLGCTPNTPLARACVGQRVIPYGQEALVLESFSSPVQLTCLARCCALPLERNLPELLTHALAMARQVYASHVRGLPLARLICLGTPFYAPMLRELMLKNGELTGLPSEAWGILEFRHGPRSWADDRCLITAIPGKQTLSFDRRAARELVDYGALVLWCAPDAPEGAIPVPWNARRGSLEESLALLAFQVGLAAELGRERQVDAAHPRHITHHVEVL